MPYAMRSRMLALAGRVDAARACRIRAQPGAAGIDHRARLDRLAVGEPNLERLLVASLRAHLVEVLAADGFDARAVAHVRPNRRMIRERLHVPIDQLMAGRQMIGVGDDHPVDSSSLLAAPSTM